MFEIGFWELVMIGLVALVVIGPERLPAVARTVARWIGRARSVVANVRAEVERELKLDELKRSLIHEETADQFKQLHEQIRTLETELRSAVQTPPAAYPDVHEPSADTPPSVTSLPAPAQPASASAEPAAVLSAPSPGTSVGASRQP